MIDTDWEWGVSNSGPGILLIWLEPWAEEFEVPLRSTLTMKIINDRPDSKPVVIEDSGDNIVVWANGGDKVEIFIDGIIQQSGSAVIEVPDVFPQSTKEFLSIAFKHQPAARLGGRAANAPMPTSLWTRLKRRLGISS